MSILPYALTVIDFRDFRMPFSPLGSFATIDNCQYEINWNYSVPVGFKRAIASTFIHQCPLETRIEILNKTVANYFDADSNGGGRSRAVAGRVDLEPFKDRWREVEVSAPRRGARQMFDDVVSDLVAAIDAAIVEYESGKTNSGKLDKLPEK